MSTSPAGWWTWCTRALISPFASVRQLTPPWPPANWATCSTGCSPHRRSQAAVSIPSGPCNKATPPSVYPSQRLKANNVFALRDAAVLGLGIAQLPPDRCKSRAGQLVAALGAGECGIGQRTPPHNQGACVPRPGCTSHVSAVRASVTTSPPHPPAPCPTSAGAHCGEEVASRGLAPPVPSRALGWALPSPTGHPQTAG